MSYEFETIQCTLVDNVLDIVLNRPESRNAISKFMDQELFAALDRAEKDPEVRAVMITGAGPMFSAGGDLKERSGDNPVFQEQEMFPLASPSVAPALARPWFFRKPLIAGVHKYVGPYALAWISHCDWVIAAEGTKFSCEVSRPTAPMLPWLPLYQLLPVRVIKKLFLLGGWMDAEEAHQFQLVQRVVPESEVRAETLRWAKQAALIPTESFGHSKETIHRTYEVMGLALAPTVLKRWGPPHEDMAAEFDRSVEELGLREAVRRRDAQFADDISKV
ncbi:enoyl-CoA hydratase/isomerase family protein [Microbacterium sp. X-17]|uniref:enoyl-CoA hydratase/isomerase family protein n=1 Tax=Microbacterium sp. X-17 TaxID=3144404 RepID=UPI0031F51882